MLYSLLLQLVRLAVPNGFIWFLGQWWTACSSNAHVGLQCRTACYFLRLHWHWRTVYYFVLQCCTACYFSWLGWLRPMASLGFGGSNGPLTFHILVLLCNTEQPATSFSFSCFDGCSKEIVLFSAMTTDHFVGHGSIIDSLLH